MGIFTKEKSKIASDNWLAEDDTPSDQPMTLEERAEYLRENAIQYIVELPDRDLENFIESARLIRDGRRKLTSVKTEVEREIEKEAKDAVKHDTDQPDNPITDDVDDADLESLLSDDELESAFLEDEPVKKTARRK